MSASRTRIIAIGFIAVASTMLASCAGGASQSGNSQSGNNSNEGINGHTVTIGISNLSSGPGAVYRPQGDGLEAYLTYRNNKGGVAGYKFNVKQLDNASTAAGGAQSMRQLIDNHAFLVGIVGTSPLSGALPLLKQHEEIPVLSYGGTAAIQQSGLKNIYGQQPDYASAAMFDMKYFVDTLGKKNVGLVYSDDALGQGAGSKAPAYAKNIGATSVTAIPVAATTTDLTPVAARLKSDGVGAVDVVALAGTLAALQKASDAIGYHPAWMTLFGYSSSYVNLAGPSGNGTYIDTFLSPLSGDSADVHLFRSEMGSISANANNEYGQTGWVFGELVALGIEKSTNGGKNPLTRAGFMEALNGASDASLPLLAGPLGYTANSHSTMANSLTVYQIKDGNLSKVSNAAPVSHS